ncbi:PAS domain S-box protein [Massilia sp. LXY-6]|uniref:PAS domain S-box protein n=1 Tax=Massilia sp. LXY-6 TaxID=3379823 RepID=UPI003EE3B099
MQERLNLESMKDVLALAVRDAPFETLTASLLQAACRLTGQATMAAIYVAVPRENELELAASIGMDQGLAAALARLPIGADAAACGRAAHLRQAVVVGDLAAEPRMAPWLPLARTHGVNACWSYPLHAPGGVVIGTLAFYRRAPGLPGPGLADDIAYFADLAALVVQRHLRERDSEQRDALAREHLAMVAAESERRRRLYEAVLSATPDLVYVFDLEHRFAYANAVLLQMWGKTWDEAIGKNCLELGYPGWHAEMHGREIEQVKATRRPVRGEVPFDGTFGRRMYEYILVPVLGPDGEVEAVAGTTRDVTERKQSEDELLASEQRFRTITNAMPQMVWTALPDGSIDYHNDQFDEFVGLAPGAVEGTSWAEAVLHPEDRQAGREIWQRSVARGEPYEMTYRLRHHSGEFRWILARALPLRDAGGAIVKWLGTDTDIHEKKLAEDALQDANQRKDEFLAMLAHELRNPLAPISAAAQVLRIAPADPDKVRGFAEVIGRQVNHMTSLVNDLLDVSRVTRGMVQYEKADVDLRSVIMSAVEQLGPLLEARRHALSLDLGPDAAHLTVRGDRARLIQVFANLLANAAKYTAAGGRIAVALETAGTGARVRVSDNGSGIEASLLPHVFDLFTQGARTPDRAQGGLGLGLALARTIALAHGGMIHAHSEGAGQGSSFTVELPLATSEGAVSAGADGGGAASAGAPLSLMLVDDNVDAVTMLAALLAAAGHKVESFSDPRSALAAAPAAAPDAFILDIGMPGVDGYELARRLRAHPACRGALYVALTGYGQQGDRELTRQAGFDHHFVKPVDAGQLLAALRQRAPRAG